MITCCFMLELHRWILLLHTLRRVSFWLETLQLTGRQRNTFLSEVLHVKNKCEHMGSPGFIYGDLGLQTLLSHNKQTGALITAPVVFLKAKGRWHLG